MINSRTTPLPLVKVAMPPKEKLLPELEKVLYSGMIGEGESVYTFENKFSETFNVPHTISTNSGTAALHIALLLAGAAPNREVITTSMTAEPTNTVILQTGATPVFADVDPNTGNLCPTAVAASITARTVAICVVHYAGYPADLSALRAIADTHGVALIEDCAHALGAKYRGQPIGTIGDSGIFSFQAIKHMTTVDGGALTLRDSNQAHLARQLRWFGLTKGVPRTEVDLKQPGFKYNMNNVTAAIGLKQLETIGNLIDRHQENGKFYDSAFSRISGLQPAIISEGADPSYWIYTLLCDDSDAVEKCLMANQVTASKLHRPNHYHSVFSPFAKSMPGLDRFYKRLMHIPCGWWVNDEDREKIVDLLKRG